MMQGSLDLRQVVRSLRRAPLFTTAASLTLALGIGAAAAIFSIVYVVLLEPLPYRDAARLVVPQHTLLGIGIPTAPQSPGTYFQYQRGARTIASIGVFVRTSANLSYADGSGEPERVNAAQITTTLLPTLGVSPAQGRNFSAAEDLPKGARVAIISDGLWRRRFGGDSKIVGREVRINGERYEVIGVMPRGFEFPDDSRDATNLLLPLQLDPASAFAGSFSYRAVARLAPGATIAATETELNRLLERLPEAFPNLFPSIPTAGLLKQAKAHAFVQTMHDEAVGSIARLLWIVAAVVGLVLVVTCANVANLMLVRAEARARETAVRLALGARRSRLVARLFLEGALLAAVGAVVGAMLAIASVHILIGSSAGDLPRLENANMMAPIIVVTLIVAVLVTLTCSALPALRIDTGALAVSLKEGGRTGTGGARQRRVRQTLVVLQVALALLLLAGSGLLMRTALELRAVKPGFDPTGTVAFKLSIPKAEFPHPRDGALFYDQMLARLRSLPGVAAAGIVSKLPLLGGESLAPVYIERFPNRSNTLPPVYPFPVASTGYFSA
ncbi:MAG: ABC transporter permease, partial [Gemmatimonadaceae bacterium]